jgi:hypothetical protein
VKLSEIKVGEEYGIVDSKRSYGPRRVKVLGTEKKEEAYWPKGGAVGMRKRQVTVVQVKFLDVPQIDNYYGGIASYKKNAIATVESRYFAALWSELAPGVRALAEAEERRKQEQQHIDKLVRQVFGRNSRSYAHVSLRHDNSLDYTMYVRGKDVDKTLTLMLVGKESK